MAAFIAFCPEIACAGPHTSHRASVGVWRMLTLHRSTRRLRISTRSKLSENVWVWGVSMQGWGALALCAHRICMHRVHCAPYVLPLRRAQRSPQITTPLQVSSALLLLGHAGEHLGALEGTHPHPTPPLALFPQLTSPTPFMHADFHNLVRTCTGPFLASTWFGTMLVGCFIIFILLSIALLLLFFVQWTPLLSAIRPQVVGSRLLPGG